jgi:hypothetical protein
VDENKTNTERVKLMNRINELKKLISEGGFNVEVMVHLQEEITKAEIKLKSLV